MPSQFGIDTLISHSSADLSAGGFLNFVLDLSNTGQYTPLTSTRFVGAVLFIGAQDNQEGNWLIAALTSVDNTDPSNPILTIESLLESGGAGLSDEFYISVISAPTMSFPFIKAVLTAGVSYTMKSDFFITGNQHQMLKNKNVFAKGANAGGAVRVNLNGTVSLTNGNLTLTGIGTAFLTELASGTTFTTAGGYTYSIDSITNNTSAQLVQAAKADEAGVAAFRGIDLFSDSTPSFGFAFAEIASIYILLIQEDATGDLDFCYSSYGQKTITPPLTSEFDVPAGWNALDVIAMLTATITHTTESIIVDYEGDFLEMSHPVATHVYYDNDTSGLAAEDAQTAIDILAASVAGAAPNSADYLVKTANAGLSAERVVTDTATITWDWSVGGQAKANFVGTVPTEASQAQMEAAAATGVYASPANLLYYPGMPKAIYSATVTPTAITGAATSWDITAETCLWNTNHLLTTGDTFIPVTNAPGGTTNLTPYYVNVVSAAVFSLHLTLAAAIAGTSKVNITSSTLTTARKLVYSNVSLNLNMSAVSPITGVAATANIGLVANPSVTLSSAVGLSEVATNVVDSSPAAQTWVQPFATSMTTTTMTFTGLKALNATGLTPGTWSQQGTTPFIVTFKLWGDLP